MSTALTEALATARDTAQGEFEERDATDVVAQTRRSVKTFRTAAASAATIGVLALGAGLLWAAESLAGTRTATANPSPAAEEPPGSDEAPATPWTTLALAVVAQPRQVGERRIDSAAGMICHHEFPSDDPRVAIELRTEPNSRPLTNVENCVPVWFKDGPITSDRNASAEVIAAGDDGLAAIGSSVVIGNLSDRPIAIDGDSIFMWIETDQEAPGDSEPAEYSHTLVAPSMWSADDDNFALLGSNSRAVRIIPGQYHVASALAEEVDADGTLSALVESGENFTVTFWARVHEDTPTKGATYLIRLGEEHTYGGIDG